MSESPCINMVIFYNHYPIITCKPIYIGFMGIFINDVRLDYPTGTLLEVSFIDFDDFYHIEGQRFSMLVNNSDVKGTSLMLANYKIDNLNRWESILSTVSNVKTDNVVHASFDKCIDDNSSEECLYSFNI